MDKQLEHSIIKTLAYFDYFNHALTREELFRFLWQPPNFSYEKFLEELARGDAKSIDSKYGYYFLSGREQIVAIRRQKTADNDYKHKITKRAAKKIRWVPFARAMLVCNNTSSEMADRTSDIDVVIIVKHGHMWTARLLVTLWLSLFGLRRNKKRTVNRICLSFYVSDSRLNLADLVITEPDIGFMYWIVQFVAVYDPASLHTDILRQNQWIKKYIPNAFVANAMGERFKVEEDYLATLWKKFWQRAWGGAYGQLVEQQTRAMQRAKMKRNLHSVQDEPDTRVVINDEVLKFHEQDRRMQYKEEWEKKLVFRV